MIKFSVHDDCWFGYSTDAKPFPVEQNAKFYEYDTAKFFIYTGTEWKEVV